MLLQPTLLQPKLPQLPSYSGLGPSCEALLTLIADMAAKKGAPVYSRQPPITPTLPDWPL